MRKSNRKLFKQLEDSRNAKAFYPDSFLGTLRGTTSSHPKRTLGQFADELRMPPQVLIDQFEHAGIIGLTSAHTVTFADKQVLLDYLRSTHRRQAEKIFSDEKPVESQIIVAETVIEDLLRHLAKEPRSVYQLAPRKFEELIARILEDQGCEVTLTKATRDGGYDIFGRLTTGPVPLVFLAECKRYSENNRVGVEVVRNLYGVTEMQRANFGMIITTSSFTKDAREEKMRIGPRIDLKEFNDLKSWFKCYRANS